jgi:hypothetical protein
MRTILLLVCVVGLAGGVASIGAVGCSGRAVAPVAGASPPQEDGAYGGSFPAVESPIMADASAGVPSADAPAVGDDGEGEGASTSTIDAGSPPVHQSAHPDAGPDGACARPLAPGDLRIDELMIESVAGAGDDGEWLEVASTLDCVANLNGLHGECPRGAKVSTFDVTDDLWLPPRAAFVVADSSDPAINHHLPGLVVPWFGHPGDVLRNQGSTITLSASGALVDTVTYPALSLAVGTSLAFPSDCDASARDDFTHWKRSTSSWFPGFLGTPNAANTDVHCP